MDLGSVPSGWGSPDLGPAFRAPLRSHLPVLRISGALDGRTPVSNAEEVQRGFPNSVHVIIEGTAHGDHLFLSTPETLNVMMNFMEGKPVAPTMIPVPPLQFDRVKPHGDN